MRDKGAVKNWSEGHDWPDFGHACLTASHNPSRPRSRCLNVAAALSILIKSINFSYKLLKLKQFGVLIFQFITIFSLRASLIFLTENPFILSRNIHSKGHLEISTWRICVRAFVSSAKRGFTAGHSHRRCIRSAFFTAAMQA